MADRRWLVACGAIAALLAVALSWDFFARALDPGSDQAWILLAAERHHGGLGLTTTLDASSNDLAVTDYRRLTYFPPGYPLLVSALRATGASMDAIVKSINALALAAGFCGWMWLAGRHLASRPARLLFALLLVLAGRGTIPRGGTTDYVFWALLPFWLLLLEKRRVVAAGIVVAAMIGFRWAAVVLIPAGALIVFLDLGVVAAALFAIVPTLTFAAISIANRVLSGGASSVLSYVESRWRFDLLLTYYPFESMFARPMALEPLLTRLWRALDASMHRSWLEFLFRLIVPLLLVVVLLRAGGVRRAVRDAFARDVAIVVACLLAMLTYLTLRHNWSGVEWSYLEEPRYFLPLFPFIALFWMLAVESIESPATRRAWLALIAAAVLYVGQAEARWTAQRVRGGDAERPLLAQLAVIAQSSPRRVVVFDNDISRYLLWDSDRFSPRPYPASADHLRASRPVDIWLVERPGQKTAYATDPQFDRKRLDSARARFHATPAWASSDGQFRLYHAAAWSTGPGATR